jgi:hypothetical protein
MKTDVTDATNTFDIFEVELVPPLQKNLVSYLQLERKGVGVSSEIPSWYGSSNRLLGQREPDLQRPSRLRPTWCARGHHVSASYSPWQPKLRRY